MHAGHAAEKRSKHIQTNKAATIATTEERQRTNWKEKGDHPRRDAPKCFFRFF